MALLGGANLMSPNPIYSTERTVKKHVREKKGLYFGRMNWPIRGEDETRYWGFVTPAGFIRCEAQVKTRRGTVVFVYAVPDDPSLMGTKGVLSRGYAA